MSPLKARFTASFAHLGLSVLVAATLAALVFLIWFPTPFREISGGRELFTIVIVVDVVLGPLLTFAVFNLKKPRSELVRDLSAIVLIQLGGLAYGLHTIYIVRPAVLALEGDRLRVVRAMDLREANWNAAPEGLSSVPLFGMLEVAARRPTASEYESAFSQAIEGKDVGMRPEFWLPSAEVLPARAKAAKPFSKLLAQYPMQAAQLKAATENLDTTSLGYLPMLARTTDWTALVDLRDGRIVGYAPVDGF